MLQADPDRVVAFRLAGQNLARRLPPGCLVAAAAACGIPSYPPGSAVLALAARVANLKPADLARALGADRCLLQTRSVRTTPLVYPTADAAVFTVGILPESEAALRHYIRGAEPALRHYIRGAEPALADLVGEALLDSLDDRELPFSQLSAELTERVARRLTSEQLREWQSPSPYAAGQSLGEALVHFGLYAVAPRGLVGYSVADSARPSGEARLARVDQLLGRPLPIVDPDRARAELARRYLHCYGPSTADAFGEWAGISPGSALLRWRLVEPDLLPVEVVSRLAWLHRSDLAAFESPPIAEGVRLLPPYDAYLAQRDRDLLVADAAARRRVWRAVGSPGVALVGGRVAATWRARKRGKRLIVSVEPLVPLDSGARSEIEAEASCLARLRDGEVAEIVFAAEPPNPRTAAARPQLGG